jgi:protein-L-isoaspartate O-methyltransferase
MAAIGDKPSEERRIDIADLILRLRRVGVTDQRMVAAIVAVPRDLFVPPEALGEAYA